jgi:hypothetical protein
VNTGRTEVSHETSHSIFARPRVARGGCSSSHKVDIGEGHEPTAVSGESLSDYAGVWDGYAEAFTWDDGTDHIRITLDSAGTGTLQWCAMQQAYLEMGTVPDRYSCFFGLTLSHPDLNGPWVCSAYLGTDPLDPSTAVPVDCGQGSTCVAYWTCTESGCSTEVTEDTQIDAALDADGQALEGTLVIGTARIVVRMTRMETE